jgi:O-antigen/teichoic acid export membrane protein
MEEQVSAQEGSTSTKPLLALSWQSLGYGLGLFGRQVIVYLSLPLFTNFMTRTEFGVVSAMTAFLAFIDTLSNAGLPAATYRLYNDSDDAQIRQKTLGSSLLLFIVYAFAVAVIVLIAAEPISEWLLSDTTYINIIRIVAVLLIIVTLMQFGYIILRIQVRPLANSLQQLLQIISQLGFSILLVLALGLGATGYWLGQLVGGIIALLLMVWLVRGMLRLHISRDRIKELLNYAIPLVPVTLSLWALRLVDRALLSSSVGLEELAVYEVGYKVGLIAGMVMLPFLAAWPQFSFSRVNKPNAPEIYRNVLTSVTTVCTFTALIIILFSQEIIRFMAPPAYSHAVVVVPWVALSRIPWAMYPVLSLGPKIAKRTIHLAWVAGIAAIVNISLNLIFIPILGIEGAAIATFVAYSLLSVMIFIVGQRFYAFPIDWKRMGKLVFTFGITAGLAYQIGKLQLLEWQEWVIRITIVILFPILLLLMGFITSSQLVEVRKSVTSQMKQRLRRSSKKLEIP